MEPPLSLVIFGSGPRSMVAESTTRCSTGKLGPIVRAIHLTDVKFRHWGCVTPDILYDLAFLDINRIPGMDKLRQGLRLFGRNSSTDCLVIAPQIEQRSTLQFSASLWTPLISQLPLNGPLQHFRPVPKPSHLLSEPQQPPLVRKSRVLRLPQRRSPVRRSAKRLQRKPPCRLHPRTRHQPHSTLSLVFQHKHLPSCLSPSIHKRCKHHKHRNIISTTNINSPLLRLRILMEHKSQCLNRSGMMKATATTTSMKTRKLNTLISICLSNRPS